MQPLESWGRYPAARQAAVPVAWRTDLLPRVHGSVLPFGRGRSYGDCCLNDGGTLLETSRLDRFIEFDPERGVLRCEAGVRLAEVLGLVVPRGWVVPVVPGTQFVSVGGAIANDIHGKNHVRVGTFGRHVLRLELLRSSGERMVCSRTENPELFAATVAGLGLTGLITWAELQLRAVQGPFIDSDTVPFRDLDQFFALDAESADRSEYTMAWVDCRPGGLRGLYFRGEHSTRPGKVPPAREPRSLPLDFPRFTVSAPTMAAFNWLYNAGGRLRSGSRQIRYGTFFFPLDGLGRWNRLYGKRGMLQFQCVVPDRTAVRALLDRIAASRSRSIFPTAGRPSSRCSRRSKTSCTRPGGPSIQRRMRACRRAASRPRTPAWPSSRSISIRPSPLRSGEGSGPDDPRPGARRHLGHRAGGGAPVRRARSGAVPGGAQPGALGRGGRRLARAWRPGGDRGRGPGRSGETRRPPRARRAARGRLPGVRHPGRCARDRKERRSRRGGAAHEPPGARRAAHPRCSAAGGAAERLHRRAGVGGRRSRPREQRRVRGRESGAGRLPLGPAQPPVSVGRTGGDDQAGPGGHADDRPPAEEPALQLAGPGSARRAARGRAGTRRRLHAVVVAAGDARDPAPPRAGVQEALAVTPAAW